MLESELKGRVKNRIRQRLPYTELTFIEPKTFSRSHPDLVILGLRAWAALEIKRSFDAPKQPNQQYRVDRLNLIGYARFVYPENLEEVLDELERLFTS